MPDVPFPSDLSEKAEDWTAVGDQIAAGVAKHITLDAFSDAIANAIGKALQIVTTALVKGATPLARGAGKVLVDLEEPAMPILAAFVAPIVAGMFGTEVPASAFEVREDREGRFEVSNAVVEAFNKALYGETAGDIEPGDEGAKRLAGAAVHATIEGWLNGQIVEFMGEMVPIEWLHFKDFTELSHQVIQSLGLGRLVRRGFAPLVDVTAATPMRWYVNKTFTPNLLPEAEILRAFIRGDYTDSEAREELARLGYSDRRQEMLLKSAYKQLSLDDALFLQRRGTLDEAAVRERLRNQGYDDVEAQLAIAVAQEKRIVSIEDNAIAGLQRAFVSREIDEHAFSTLIPDEVYTPDERDSVIVAARALRDVNVRHMSEGEVVEAVRAAIVPMAFYRDWMTREGFPDDEQVVKELLLRSRIDKDFKADQARKDVETQRAAAAAKKQADADAKKQQLEQERALARRGPISELVRVAVRGLIPISRVEEVLRAQYDPDTVAIYVADIEAQHADYVAQQQAAEDARKRAAVQHVNVSQLEQAVLAGVLTLDEFRRQLSGLKFSAEDVALLTATLAARKKDLDAAKAQRAAAAAAAKTKHIDLAKFETLVRRGHHTIADYQALLRSLDFDDPAIADMTQLLQIEMLDDASAAKTRADAAAKAAAKGVSIEQSRRAVLIGVQTVDEFDHILADNGYTVDARAVLVAELTHDLAEADAARQRRTSADASLDPRALPLATIARAARLGIVPLDVYRQRLVAAGYSDDDVAIEMDLLVHEIADVQAARQVQAKADQAPAPSGLTLAQLAAAVKAGVRSLEDYRAAAITRGLRPADVVTLVRVLGDELANTTAAKARRAEIGSTVKAGDVSVSVLADDVRAGARTIGDYGAALAAAGLDPVDVDLLVALLGDELAGGTSG